MKQAIHIVGHDIGGMIAHAYAMLYPDEIASIVWGECPLPGTRYFDQLNGTAQHFHFVFHQVLDLPELLIAGKEREYLNHFYYREGYNSNAITNEDVERYAVMFCQPGAMRSAISVYRAFDEDTRQNKHMIKEKGKCRVTCLVLNGAKGWLQYGAEDMGREFYESFGIAIVPESGHYIAEENPKDFVEVILKFVELQKAAV